jgi:fructoselysine-6-P-deglycase FrlB-like protein
MAASFMEVEIRSQPALLAQLAEDTASIVADLGRAIACRRPRFAILAARGTSDHRTGHRCSATAEREDRREVKIPPE